MPNIKPYGDTLNDGKVQISFTLPLPLDSKAESVARKMAETMQLVDVMLVHAEAIDEAHSFFVLYGSIAFFVNTDDVIVTETTEEALDKEAIEALIEANFDRDLVFVGASTGSDAHTVGIDAIMNMKGYAGHYGLERYKGIQAINLGSQVTNEALIKCALEKNADVLLVSQTVTQKDVHVKNLTELMDLLEAEGIRDRFLVIVGGARISHALAKELGFDAGFGPKKYANDVATFAVKRLIEKNNG